MTSWQAVPRTALVTTMLALGAYSAICPKASEGRMQGDDFSWSNEMRAGSTLRVFTVAGTVTVRESAGATARVRGDTEAGRDPIRYATDRRDGAVRICALTEGAECGDRGINNRSGRRWRTGRQSRANFTIEVPRGVGVHVSSGNGDVSVAGTTADVRAASGNGAVRVAAGAARVDASSGNGEVRVDGARGPVDASSGNGKIVVSTSAGPVGASTGNGSVDVSMASLRGGGDLEFSTGNGDVTLRLPRDFGAELDASTGNGRVSSEFPMRMHGGRADGPRVRATVGNGGRRLQVSTGNGSIQLRRAGG